MTTASAPTVLSTKAIEAKQKLDFELHVALLMRSENLSKSKATFRAWTEGPSGLEKRLGR